MSKAEEMLPFAVAMTKLELEELCRAQLLAIILLHDVYIKKTRAEALEEAAKICESNNDKLHKRLSYIYGISEDNLMSVSKDMQVYLTFKSGQIRALKESE